MGSHRVWHDWSDLAAAGIDLLISKLSCRASLIAKSVKNLPAMQEMCVQSLGQKDPTLEKEMATHSNILAWRTLWTEEPGRLQSMGLQELGTTWWLNHLTILSPRKITLHPPKSQDCLNVSLQMIPLSKWRHYSCISFFLPGLCGAIL